MLYICFSINFFIFTILILCNCFWINRLLFIFKYDCFYFGKFYHHIDEPEKYQKIIPFVFIIINFFVMYLIKFDFLQISLYQLLIFYISHLLIALFRLIRNKENNFTLFFLIQIFLVVCIFYVIF